MAQATFTVLGNGNISNGIFSVRYVMDGDTPRFVLKDVISDLGYAGASTTVTYWTKKLGGGKLYNVARGQLVNCVTKEQVDELLHRRYKGVISTAPFSNSYEHFWNGFVSVRIEAEKANVRIRELEAKIVSLEAALREREVA